MALFMNSICPNVHVLCLRQLFESLAGEKESGERAGATPSVVARKSALRQGVIGGGERVVQDDVMGTVPLKC